MTARGRSYVESHEWDDFNSGFQYPDDDVSSQNVNPRRLYITNIPSMLNDEGLRTAFSQFGILEEVYVSRDPTKKYGMVKFETPGEAKLAMMKMNRTEPLKLVIRLAQAGKKGQSKDREWSNSARDRGSKAETNSVSSQRNIRQQEDLTNGNDMEDEMELQDSIDPELHLELESLRLQQLKVQAEQLQCKHRMLLLKQAEKKSHHPTSNIQCILPDGRIVARNVSERPESRDADPNYGAGAGDSLTIPGLQSSQSRVCLRCGAAAVAFCARCGVAPYCSQGCQRRDWTDRHKSVCHNLARLPGGSNANDVTEPGTALLAQPASPLRRPRSPASNKAGSEKCVRLNKVPQNPGMTGRGSHRRQGDRKPHENQGNDQFPDTLHSSPKPAVTVKVEPSIKREQTLPKEVANAPKMSAKDEKIPPIGAKTPKAPSKDVIPSVSDLKFTRRVDNAAKERNEAVKPTANGQINALVKNLLVPKTTMFETLSRGDTVVLTVEAAASECRTNRPGFVCVTMHEKYTEDYQMLCDDLGNECQLDKTGFIPSPGDTFSYLNAADGGWYRARCLNRSLVALLDAGKLAPLSPADRCRRLPTAYLRIPEFCCVLDAKAVQVGNSLKCTVLSKNNDVCSVEVENMETDQRIGTGEVSRWLPQVEYPKLVPPAAAPAPSSPVIPEVPRPDVTNKSRVFLVEMTDIDRAFVRPADSASIETFDSIVQDVVQFARNATPLSEPPTQGQTVLVKSSDGVHYRGLCKRTNVRLNKYLVEHIDLGSVEVYPLERLVACPGSLQLGRSPAMTSHVRLAPEGRALTPPAKAYISRLKEAPLLLELSIPSGAKSAPSGSVVALTVLKNNENVNKMIADMCTPDWKKLEEKGSDVVELECLMYSELEYTPLPGSGCELEVLDISCLEKGSVSACRKGDPHALYVHTTLSEKIGEYCNSEVGRQPYLPRVEELCIAQCPPYPQWFRAIVLELPEGAGGPAALLNYVDYGNVETVPVALLRKMLPEFLKGLPAVATLVDIKDFPDNPTPEMLTRAVEYMQINEEGRGTLRVTKCTLQDEEGMYLCEAPDLIAAVMGK